MAMTFLSPSYHWNINVNIELITIHQDSFMAPASESFAGAFKLKFFSLVGS